MEINRILRILIILFIILHGVTGYARAPAPNKPYLVYVGEFKVTAYSAHYRSCGKQPDDPNYGITATMTRVKEGRTAAADWDILPPGTPIYIEDVGYRNIEDRGGAVQGEHIDLYFDDEDVCDVWGVQNLKVYVVKR